MKLSEVPTPVFAHIFWEILKFFLEMLGNSWEIPGKFLGNFGTFWEGLPNSWEAKIVDTHMPQTGSLWHQRSQPVF